MTPEQEEQVRRALAAAGHRDEPATMPPEVAARLDDVLADLTGPRAAAARDVTGAPDPDRATGGSAGRGAGAGSGIVDLAARRRRRWPNRLAAAAAVAVIALAGFTVATRGLSNGGEETSAGSASQDSGVQKAAPSQAGGSAGSRSGGPSAASGALPVPRLDSATLRRDMRRVAAGTATAGTDELRGQAAVGPKSSGRACERPATRRGDERVAVLLDGRPATLVLRAPRAGSREAQVYSCDAVERPLTSTTFRPAKTRRLP